MDSVYVRRTQALQYSAQNLQSRDCFSFHGNARKRERMIKTESCVGEGMCATKGMSDTRLEKQKEGIKVEEEKEAACYIVEVMSDPEKCSSPLSLTHQSKLTEVTDHRRSKSSLSAPPRDSSKVAEISQCRHSMSTIHLPTNLMEIFAHRHTKGFLH